MSFFSKRDLFDFSANIYRSFADYFNGEKSQGLEQVKIENNKVFINGEGFHAVRICDIEIKKTNWLFRWLPYDWIYIKYKPNRQEKYFFSFGDTKEISSIFNKCSNQFNKRISCLLTEKKARIRDLERDKNKLLLKNTYFRYSQAKRFSENEEELEQIGASLSTYKNHPLTNEINRANAVKRINVHMTLLQFVKDIEQIRGSHNKEFISQNKNYMFSNVDFFKCVESKPLNDEQIKAALVFEDANQVIASAGSGKSSCIVAKIGFALASGMFKDNEILTLTYNRKANEQLKERLEERLEGMLGRKIKVASRTFHGFGLYTMFRANSSLSVKILGMDDELDKDEIDMVDADYDETKRTLHSIVLDLLAEDDAYADAVADFLSSSDIDDPVLEGNFDNVEEMERQYEKICKKRLDRIYKDFDSAAGKRGRYDGTIPTYDPTLFVRSNQERKIVNWLLSCDVDFKYEEEDFEGAKRLGLGKSPRNKQIPYTPDFTYRAGEQQEIRVVHEHFGLDKHGNAPQFKNGTIYVQHAENKRQMFNSWTKEESGKNIRFFETTSADFYDGSIFDKLRECLEFHGVEVRGENPEYKQRALQSFRNAEGFRKLISEFVLLMKDSGFTEEEITELANQCPNPARANKFINIAFKVSNEYRNRLGNEFIDFSDMLLNGVDILNKGPRDLPYKLILVDEFQDISKLKADMVKALLNLHADDSVLFCVGDDWQTINRFAGSDIKIFTEMERYFSRKVESVYLKRTYRCQQDIADVASHHVLLNKGQIKKKVIAPRESLPGVRIVEHEFTPDSRLKALIGELDRICTEIKDLNIIDRKPEVFILRRSKLSGILDSDPDRTTQQQNTKRELKFLANKYKGAFTLDVSKSMHQSKGLEADFVILLGLDSGMEGFPGEVESDPLMDFILPKLDDPIEEERRLFYVGLTRARYQTVILCSAEAPSQFVQELKVLEEKHPALEGKIEWELTGKSREACPQCLVGSLIKKPWGKNGSKMCSRSNSCGYIQWL